MTGLSDEQVWAWVVGSWEAISGGLTLCSFYRSLGRRCAADRKLMSNAERGDQKFKKTSQDLRDLVIYVHAEFRTLIDKIESGKLSATSKQDNNEEVGVTARKMNLKIGHLKTMCAVQLS